MTKFSYQNFIKSYEVTKEITIEEFISLIKDNPNKATIDHLRTIGKEDPLYPGIKEQLPAISPNGTFKQRRRKDHLKELSGFIYMDIDKKDLKEAGLNLEEVILFIKSQPYVYALWKSVSGEGVGFLIKVEGLDIYNFTKTWKEVKSILNLPIDEKPKAINAACFISYDPNLFINENCIAFKIKEQKEESGNKGNLTSNEPYLYTSVSAFQETRGYSGFTNYKTYLTQEEYNEEDYKFILSGRSSTEVILPKEKIQKGNRNQTILQASNRLMFNNPFFTFEQLYYEVNKINRFRCEEPLEEEEIRRITTWTYSLHLEGKLTPSTKTKYVWFNPKSKLKKSDKCSISGKLGGVIRKNKTDDKIKKAIEELYEQEIIITQKNLSEASGISERTLRNNNRWENLKPVIDEINKSIEQNKSDMKEDKTKPKEIIMEELSEPKSQGSPVNPNLKEWFINQNTDMFISAFLNNKDQPDYQQIFLEVLGEELYYSLLEERKEYKVKERLKEWKENKVKVEV